jgi:hypothetical protein
MNMKFRKQIRLRALGAIVLAAFCLSATGCATDSYAAKGAASGATSGAVAGAAGGMMMALVFGGDVVEAGARGAVYGGTVGAVSGGMSGSKADREAAAREQAKLDKEIDEFRKKIGTDAFNGVVALAECKYDIALANAREATSSTNSDFALAGVWVQVLTEADRGNQAKKQALLPELVSQDSEVSSEAQAETHIAETLQELRDIRKHYDLPVDCAA